jgi:predicted secreted protein
MLLEGTISRIADTRQARWRQVAQLKGVSMKTSFRQRHTVPRIHEAHEVWYFSWRSWAILALPCPSMQFRA